jgi:hypothetical protein
MKNEQCGPTPEQIQMSKTLDMITVKLDALDDRCEPVDADICFRHGHTEFVKLPVPPTVVGRETLRALLVLAGRHEQDMINKQSRAFDVAAEKAAERLSKLL